MQVQLGLRHADYTKNLMHHFNVAILIRNDILTVLRIVSVTSTHQEYIHSQINPCLQGPSACWSWLSPRPLLLFPPRPGDTQGEWWGGGQKRAGKNRGRPSPFDGVTVARPSGGAPPSAAKRHAFCRHLRQRCRGRLGVSAVFGGGVGVAARASPGGVC